MKKSIVFLAALLWVFVLANAQTEKIIDNAVKGTGIEQHQYVGAGWVHGSTFPTFFNSSFSYSDVTGAYVTLTFIGNQVQWYTEKKWTHGKVAVSIDGGAETIVDLYSPTEQHVIVYTTPILTQGTHTFKIAVTGTKNTASTGVYLIHDYLTIKQAVTAPPLEVTNTVLGFESLSGTMPNSNNSAFGYHTLTSPYLGLGNTAVGSNALSSSTKAGFNTAVGYFALHNSNGRLGNTAVGSHALNMVEDAGYGNTALGLYAGPGVGGLANTTALGANARTTASSQVRIGDANVTSIGGQVSWSTLSDGRFKRDLRADVSGLEFINKLRPVSYTVDKIAVQKFLGVPDSVSRVYNQVKEKAIRQTGFVAQEVEALGKKSGYVFSGVDAPKNDNDPYTIRYAEFVVPLVKAVQELSAKTEEQQKQITEQQKKIEQLLKLVGKIEGENTDLQSEVTLLQNNPNPFSVNTEIKMVLPENVGTAYIIIYNLEGKQIKELQVNGRGNVSATIAGNELSAGMYIYALIVDGKVVDTKRMILTE